MASVPLNQETGRLQRTHIAAALLVALVIAVLATVLSQSTVKTVPPRQYRVACVNDMPSTCEQMARYLPQISKMNIIVDSYPVCSEVVIAQIIQLQTEVALIDGDLGPATEMHGIPCIKAIHVARGESPTPITVAFSTSNEMRARQAQFSDAEINSRGNIVDITDAVRAILTNLH